MHRFNFLVALLLPFLANAVVAQESAVFDGESFTRKFVGNLQGGDKLLEFVREAESFEKWTKLVGYRYQKIPGAGNDPRSVAAGMGQSLKARNPEAQYKMIVNKENTEALIDFLIRAPGGAFMEFNVFRYARSTDGNAVISLQLASRFDDVSPEGVERFKKQRESWINQAIAFDMKLVEAALSQRE